MSTNIQIQKDIEKELKQKSDEYNKLSGEHWYRILCLAIISVVIIIFLFINEDDPEIQKIFITSSFALFGGGVGGFIGVKLK